MEGKTMQDLKNIITMIKRHGAELVVKPTHRNLDDKQVYNATMEWREGALATEGLSVENAMGELDRRLGRALYPHEEMLSMGGAGGGTKSIRKPYNDVCGYVSSRKCQAECGGHIVIYDRQNGFEIDADERWIIMHELSSLHIAVPSRSGAYRDMKLAAKGLLEEILPPMGD